MTQSGSMTGAKVKLIAAMAIFGTIGLFVRHIPLPSSVIALARGFVGMAFLLLVTAAGGARISGASIRSNLPLLLLSGACLGVNWILLFEAYRFTTVATATLCYYLAPIFVILASPLVLRERLTGRKLACVAGALAGMVLVSGVPGGAAAADGNLRGILLGIGAAAFYASVVLLNKGLRGISAYDRTVVQLGVSAAVLLPYVLLTQKLGQLSPGLSGLALLAVVGIVHTGVAYALYFGSMGELPAQTVALFSYIDPVVAILLSAVVLREGMGLAEWVGAALVLGSTLISELPERREKSPS